MPTLYLNKQAVSFQMGQTILQVAQEHGVAIPTLCHLPGVRATGQCRICVVEVADCGQLLPVQLAGVVNLQLHRWPERPEDIIARHAGNLGARPKKGKQNRRAAGFLLAIEEDRACQIISRS